MRDGDWHVRRDVGECTLHIGDGGLFRDLSCDDRESGPASGAKRFAPWPGGKESRFSCPGVSVHQQNICVPPSSAMLECIIENNDIDTLGDCLADSANSVGRSNHRDPLIESLVNDDFVTTIAAQHNCGSGAFL